MCIRDSPRRPWSRATARKLAEVCKTSDAGMMYMLNVHHGVHHALVDRILTPRAEQTTALTCLYLAFIRPRLGQRTEIRAQDARASSVCLSKNLIAPLLNKILEENMDTNVVCTTRKNLP